MMLNGLMMHFISKNTIWIARSILKNPLGAHFITAQEYDGCLTVSRWHLKCLQDGTLQDYTRVINDGVVGGKL